MVAKLLKILLPLTLVAAGTAEIVVLRMNHARLQQHAVYLRQRNERMAQLRERTQDLITRATDGDASAVRTIHAELVQARAEVSELEKGAEERRLKRTAQSDAAASAMTSNRDPEKGLVRLENFRNIGRATPSAAFQTLMWAAVKGDDDTIARMLSVTGAAREKADAFIAALPEETRAIYPTPETLAALAFADMALGQTAVQVLRQTTVDPLNTNLSVAGAENAPKTFSFRLGAGGWQMVVPEQAIQGIQNRLNGGSTRAPAK